MAHTFPNELPTKATSGERRMLAALKRLPDDVLVYYEPVIDQSHPDFVVIIPTLGVLLIEVKGWYLSNILKGDSYSILIKRDDEPQKEYAHPLRQVRDYKFALMDRVAKDPQISKLVHITGHHVGRFSFPFGSFAVLSNITRSSLASVPLTAELFPNSTVATKDQLAEWGTLDPQELHKVLASYFQPFWPIATMSQNQVNIVKAAIHPEVLLSLDFHDNNGPEGPTVKVLDSRQQQIARDVGAGHRLVFGVAGSGKTVLLIARAKLLARLRPSARVLVLCYNVTLGSYLAEGLKEFSTITVMNFHSWARSNGVTWNPSDESAMGKELLHVLQKGGPDAKRFDCILIDEAQDFEAAWFSCVLASMRDPENGDLLIVGDGSQGVYRHARVSWKQLGIKAQGRTQYLDSNYRNTRPILALASLFAAKELEIEDDSVCTPFIDLDKCLRLEGADPVLLTRLSKQDEVDRVVQLVDDLMDGRWFDTNISPLKAEQIAILYPRLRKEDRAVIQNLITTLRNNRHDCPVVWLSENSASRRSIGEPGVKILTMHGSKGLQFKAVILLFADECPAHFPDTDVAKERCLFYVALTRAEDYLAVSCSKRSEFIQDIEMAAVRR